MTDKAREDKVRRALRKEGLRLVKDRRRNDIGITASLSGGYMLVDENNIIQAGEGYTMSLEDVERYAAD